MRPDLAVEESSNGRRGGARVTSPLSSSRAPRVLQLWCCQYEGGLGASQDVRGFSVETLRERGERDAEIEVCLLTGNPINQQMNVSPFPSLSSSASKLFLKVLP